MPPLVGNGSTSELEELEDRELISELVASVLLSGTGSSNDEEVVVAGFWSKVVLGISSVSTSKGVLVTEGDTNVGIVGSEGRFGVSASNVLVVEENSAISVAVSLNVLLDAGSVVTGSIGAMIVESICEMASLTVDKVGAVLALASVVTITSFAVLDVIVTNDSNSLEVIKPEVSSVSLMLDSAPILVDVSDIAIPLSPDSLSAIVELASSSEIEVDETAGSDSVVIERTISVLTSTMKVDVIDTNTVSD